MLTAKPVPRGSCFGWGVRCPQASVYPAVERGSTERTEIPGEAETGHLGCRPASSFPRMAWTRPAVQTSTAPGPGTLRPRPSAPWGAPPLCGERSRGIRRELFQNTLQGLEDAREDPADRGVRTRLPAAPHGWGAPAARLLPAGLRAAGAGIPLPPRTHHARRGCSPPLPARSSAVSETRSRSGLGVGGECAVRRPTGHAAVHTQLGAPQD